MKSWWVVLAILFLGTQAEAQSAWTIRKTEWSPTDERAYEDFVVSIGRAVERRECLTVKECLKSSANPYRATDPSTLRLYADCADFPYYLRAYFAWKNGLPFSMATAMVPRKVPGNEGSDIRYSKQGNTVSKRMDVITPASGRPLDAVTFLNKTLINSVSSAMFRVHAEEGDGPRFSDFYPIEISRRAVRPGSIVYDPNGHVAVIYKVGTDGRAHFIDAHPDNTLTSGIYGKQFVRSNPGHGAGFREWRPIRLVGAQLSGQGTYIGGKIQAASNREIPLYSTTQIYGTHPDPSSWKAGKFIENGQAVDYYDYVRLKLADGRLLINPIEEMQGLVQEVCSAVRDRVTAVDTAIRSGIQNQAHPARLPENIYGTHGDWENYSTPSRDARLRVVFREVLERTRTLLDRQAAGDAAITYSGGNLAADLLNVYERESRSCEISYTNSVGRPVFLNLEDIRQRLFLLSFDPYHCVELRWGAFSPDELASCADDSNKRLWYRREQFLRNQLERTYDARMDFNLEELATLRPGNGVADAPDVNVGLFLKSRM